MSSEDGEAQAASILEPGGSAGLRAALEALELGCAMFLEQLRRENPEATEEELEALFLKRMAERPLDAPGLRRAFPDAGAGA
jgi:hypothetical protein